MVVLEVRLPPEGLLVRDLVVAPLVLLASNALSLGLGVEAGGGVVRVEGGADDLAEVLYSVFSSAKGAARRLRDMGVRSPPLHKNDADVWSKRLSPLLGGVEPPADYLGCAEVLAGWAESRLSNGGLMEAVESYGSVSVSPQRVVLGGGEIPNPQPFKVEKYEYGKGFAELARYKYNVKMNPWWMALVFAGYALSHSLYSGGEILLSLTPEEVLARAAAGDPDLYGFAEAVAGGGQGLFEALYGGRGLYTAPSRVGLPTEPLVAYSLLLALSLARDLGDAKPPAVFLLARIAFTGRTFTLLERASLNVRPLLGFAGRLRRLDEAAARDVEDLCRCALLMSRVPSRRCQARFGDYTAVHRAVVSLYGGVIGSRSPADVVYELARGLNAFSSSTLRCIFEALTG